MVPTISEDDVRKRIQEIERKKAEEAAKAQQAAQPPVAPPTPASGSFVGMPGFTPAQIAPKIIAKHTLTADQTLSHVALKYYGSAYKPYWMVIYNANKEIIGDNPAHVREGMVLDIPELPEELKAKK